MMEGEPDSGKFDRNDQQRGRDEGQQGTPRREAAQPRLQARYGRPLGDRRHGQPEVVQQRLLDEDDRRRNRDEQQLQGVFEMAFHVVTTKGAILAFG